MVSETEGDPTVEARLIDHLLGRQVGGLIYATLSTSHVRLPRVLTGHPTVLLKCLASNLAVPAIVPDEAEAGRTAATRLSEAGHRSGVHVVRETPPEVLAAQERMAGIVGAMDSASARLAGSVDCPWWPEPAFDAVARLLRSDARPAALICMNDGSRSARTRLSPKPASSCRTRSR